MVRMIMQGCGFEYEPEKEALGRPEQLGLWIVVTQMHHVARPENHIDATLGGGKVVQWLSARLRVRRSDVKSDFTKDR